MAMASVGRDFSINSSEISSLVNHLKWRGLGISPLVNQVKWGSLVVVANNWDLTTYAVTGTYIPFVYVVCISEHIS